jgi:hypothetical protein
MVERKDQAQCEYSVESHYASLNILSNLRVDSARKQIATTYEICSG